LTRRFAERGPEGLETLTLILSDYLGRAFKRVLVLGGDIENYYGDGFLAIWPTATGKQSAGIATAKACAAALIQEFDDFPVALDLRLRIRCAVVAGSMFAVEAGGVAGRWLWCIAGPCLEELGPLLEKSRPG